MDLPIKPRGLALGLNPVRDLPNRAGFEFIGVDHDGKENVCRVVVWCGMHVIEGVRASTLKGWKPAA